MYKINKSFQLDWAHRVYNQDLHGEMCEINNPVCKCKHVHGHTGTFIVGLCSETLDDSDMVIDFNMIGFVKKLINNELDHHFALYRRDPLTDNWINTLSKMSGIDVKMKLCEQLSVADFKVYVVDLDNVDLSKIDDEVKKSGYQSLEGLVVFDFNTTSETLSHWMFDLVDRQIKQYNEKYHRDVRTDFVSYKETPTSCATYTR